MNIQHLTVIQSGSLVANSYTGDTILLVRCNICGVFNKFPNFFVQAFKIVEDSSKFSMLLLYIL